MTPDTRTENIDRSEVEYVKRQHWRYEGTDYVLGYIVTECSKCGEKIADDEAGYIRDGPRANGGEGGMDELCFWCGNEVTGFAD